ncbi:MAG: hypothetical protein A2085_05445 [Gemmatimonadetes bacterium GWC2_71_10]|nr:MAG: hypothetical protein A2085_05445 [Gemmatimonadetes bacterium GWC2_71_10]
MNPLRPRLDTVMRVYPVALGAAGLVVLLGAVLQAPPRGVAWWGLLGFAALVTLLRRFVIPLSKYSYLTFVSFVGLTASLLVGPAVALLALYAGILAGDAAWLRKPLRFAVVNGGREVVALAAAFGLYLVTLRLTGVAGHGLSLETVPALAFFAVGYFVIGRGLFYCTLMLRAKLLPDERSLLLRYEVIGYFASLAGAATALIAAATLDPISWPFVAALLLFTGSMLKRLLEEAIGAEERTKVLAVDVAVTADLSLRESLDRVSQLAGRLVEWSDLRIYRRSGDAVPAEPIFRSPPDGPPLPADVGLLRAEVLAHGAPVIVHDARRDVRIAAPRDGAQSILVLPLRWGERVIGTLELEHHKRRMYGAKAIALVGTLASQVAAAMHIAGLREPLMVTVERIGAEVRRVAAAAEGIRRAAAASADHAGTIERGAGQQEREVEASLATTEQLTVAARQMAGDGRDAAARSEEASRVASDNRDTIGSAVGRLVELKGFVADSSGQIRSLVKVTRSITDFVGLIRDIADQTNLLALNAAIEAARAGGHGRGFAVVADEVRRLADQSATAASEVGQLIGAIQKQMTQVVELMRRGETAVRGVEELSGASLSALEAIVVATAGATAAARRIAGTAAEQDAALHALTERVRTSAEVSRRNRDEAEDMADRAGDQARELAELEKSARELEAVAAQLRDVARRFANA